MNERSHVQILKSTTIIGGSSVLNVLFRILGLKAVALLVGPAGVGIIGLFNAATGLAVTIAGMGLASSSGVRQIAEAVSSGDKARIARTVFVLRRVSLLLGLLGTLIFFALRVPISQVTFGSDKYAAALGVLSITICLTVVSSTQAAFIRGFRRVGDLARVNVWGVVLGTFLGLPVLYWWGVAGIAPYLLITAGMAILVSWWYMRKLPIALAEVTWYEVYRETQGMLGLGGAFMLSTLATTAAAYLVKVLVIRQMGLEAAGLYEAASALANVYVGFILGAMGADFFPHLTAVSHDNVQSTELMNAQVEVGLLAAIPGILVMLALGPLLLQLLYSAEFTAAFAILRWQILGTFLRVVSWPLSYIILAKGKGGLFFWSELVTNLFYLGCIGVGVKLLELAGIGLAFFMMYIFHTILMVVLAQRLSGFRLSKRPLFLIKIVVPVFLLAFGASLWLPSNFSTGLNLVLALAAGWYSLKSLYTLVRPALAQVYLLRLKNRLGCA